MSEKLKKMNSIDIPLRKLSFCKWASPKMQKIIKQVHSIETPGQRRTAMFQIHTCIDAETTHLPASICYDLQRFATRLCTANIDYKFLLKGHCKFFLVQIYILVMYPSLGSARFWLELLKKKLGSARLGSARLGTFLKKLGF